jgi:PhnB protein
MVDVIATPAGERRCNVLNGRIQAMPVKAIPEGYHAVTPYLFCKGAAAAIEYYQKAFGATELMRHAGPDGQIGHAEIKIGDSVIMLADEYPVMKALSPQTIGGTAVLLLVYVDDVDAVFARALAAGGKQLHPLEDKFYGDRTGTLIDPFGHMWTVATHREDVSPEEMTLRADAAVKDMKETGGS